VNGKIINSKARKAQEERMTRGVIINPHLANLAKLNENPRFLRILIHIIPANAPIRVKFAPKFAPKATPNNANKSDQSTHT
jgi:hypothetical protein